MRVDERLLGRLKRGVLSDHLILWLSVAYVLGMAPWATGFVSVSNAQTILAYLLPVLVVSVGLTLVLIIGGIDLSVTSIIALASVLGAKVMSGEEGWMAGNALAVPVGVLVMLAVGLGLGAVNGFTVAVCRIPAFIATLTTMMFVSGFAIWVTLSRKIGGLPAGFVMLGQNLWVATVMAVAVTWLAHGFLSRTLYGRWLYAVGQNARAALVSGVPVGRVTFWTYVASGGFAGLSAILFTAGLETGNPEMARDNLLDVVGAVVIGGTSLYGGRGRVLPMALLIMLLVGAGFGAVNGLFITRLGIMAFVVTLATRYFGRGLGLQITETRAMNLPDSFYELGAARVVGVPVPVLIFAGVVVVAHVVLTRTPFGRQIYAVGADLEAARKAGIRTRWVLWVVYVLCGVCAAVAGVVALSQAPAVSPTFGNNREFLAIAAAVLGGTSLFGGRGAVFPGTVLGAVLIQTIENGLNILNVNPYLYPLITSGVIFVAVLLDSLRNGWLVRWNRRKIFVTPDEAGGNT